MSGASSWPVRRWRATAATATCSSRRAARCTRSASILNASTTLGESVQVAAAIARDPSTGAAQFACASDGTLAYVPATSLSDMRQLFWADESGHMESVKLPPGPYQEARISPDGRYAVMLGGTSLNGDVWVLEFASGTFRRFTFTSSNTAPIWSADEEPLLHLLRSRLLHFHLDEETGRWQPGRLRRWHDQGTGLRLLGRPQRDGRDLRRNRARRRSWRHHPHLVRATVGWGKPWSARQKTSFQRP